MWIIIGVGAIVFAILNVMWSIQDKEPKGLFEKSEAFFVTFWHFHLYYQ